MFDYDIDRHGQKFLKDPDNSHLAEMLARHAQQPTESETLLQEIRALRAEMQELKDAMRPSPILILRGQDLLDAIRVLGETK